MKIKEYPKATELADTDAFVIETDGGTKYVEKTDMPFDDSTKIKIVGTIDSATLGKTAQEYFTLRSVSGYTAGGYRYISVSLDKIQNIPEGTYLSGAVSLNNSSWSANNASPNLVGVTSNNSHFVLGSMGSTGSISLYFPTGWNTSLLSIKFGPYVPYITI